MGTNLANKLIATGHEVVIVDNLISGLQENVAGLDGGKVLFIKADVSDPLEIPGRVDGVFHMASIASPVFYQKYQVETLTVGARGTENVLEYAIAHNTRVLITSTSEVYGDPLVHPQTENYWGNVNPIGPRSMYDESKRYTEALAVAYQRQRNADVALVRIFNTYGPGMRPDDGRVIPAFIMQAIHGQTLTIHGDGNQTRSFCYVDDMIAGLLGVFSSGRQGPYNLGNPSEVTIGELAALTVKLTGSTSGISYVARPVDDPQKRLPDITRAKDEIGWEPMVELEDGLARTIEYFRSRYAG